MFSGPESLAIDDVEAATIISIRTDVILSWIFFFCWVTYVCAMRKLLTNT